MLQRLTHLVTGAVSLATERGTVDHGAIGLESHRFIRAEGVRRDTLSTYAGETVRARVVVITGFVASLIAASVRRAQAARRDTLIGAVAKELRRTIPGGAIDALPSWIGGREDGVTLPFRLACVRRPTRRTVLITFGVATNVVAAEPR